MTILLSLATTPRSTDPGVHRAANDNGRPRRSVHPSTYVARQTTTAARGTSIQYASTNGRCQPIRAGQFSAPPGTVPSSAEHCHPVPTGAPAGRANFTAACLTSVKIRVFRGVRQGPGPRFAGTAIRGGSLFSNRTCAADASDS